MTAKTLITLTGSSCSGKSTIESFLFESLKGSISKIRSTTTRSRRSGEGKDAYYFVSLSEFNSMQQNGQLLEFSSTNGCYYGISNKGITDAFLSNDNAIVVVDPNGVNALKDFCKKNSIQLITVCVQRGFQDCLKSLISRISRKQVSALTGIKRISRFLLVEYWWRYRSYDLYINNNTTTSQFGKLLRPLLSRL